MKSRLYLLFSCLLSIIISLILINPTLDAAKGNAQKSFLNSTHSDSIVLYDGGSFESETDNDFYYLNHDYSIRKEDTKIRADILMVKPKVTYTIFNLAGLKSNEIIISKNLAVEYELSLGDRLSRTSFFNNDVFEYVIKEIIQPIFSISVNYMTSAGGLVIAGYDGVITTHQNDSLAFIKRNVAINNLQLNQLISIKHVINDVNVKINLSFLATYISALCTCVLTSIAYIIDKLYMLRSQIIFGAYKKRIFSQFCIWPLIISLSCSSLFFLSNCIIPFTVLHFFALPLTNCFVFTIPILILIFGIIAMCLFIRRT